LTLAQGNARSYLPTVVTDDLLKAQHEWTDAQVALDTFLTQILPRAMVADPSGPDGYQVMTEAQLKRISELYGRVVGLWARYCSALRGEHLP
jgi:hypothetical protein